jgi:uncharacterized protein YegP (UPF0339 family)
VENPKFIIFVGKDGQFYFRLTARNSEPILASEGYTNKLGCVNGINSVKNNAVKDEHFKRLIATNGEFFFTLVAENGEVVGKSETYKTQQGGDNGIEAVKNTAPNAPIEDTTLTPEIKVFESVKNNASFTPAEDKAVTTQPKANEEIKSAGSNATEKHPSEIQQPKEISHSTRDGGTQILLWLIIILLTIILSLNIVQIIQHMFG